MNPYLAALILIAAVVALVALLTAWSSFTMRLAERHGWPDRIGVPVMLSPLLVGGYFLFAFIFTITEGK